MLTVADIEVMETANWKDFPPKYEKLTDKRSVEWDLVQEFSNIKAEFEKLTKLTDEVSTWFVNGLQYGHIKEWKEVAEKLLEFENIIEEKVDEILLSFD